MRYRKHLDGIIRKSVPKFDPTKVRLHMCERTKPFSEEMFGRFLSSLSQEDFITYGDCIDLKDRLAKKHGVKPSNIYIGAGSSYVLDSIFRVFVEKGSWVVMPEAHFPLYDVFVEQNQANVELLPYFNVNGKLTMGTSVKQDYPRLIIIGNPNSPVGDVVGLDRIKQLAALGAPLVIDQAYGEFGKTEVPISMIEKDVIFVNTLSKGFGAAGIRVGYAVANEKIITLLDKFRQMFEVTNVSQKFALFLLDNEKEMLDYCESIVLERSKLRDKLEHVYFGNWVHIPHDKYCKLGNLSWEVKTGTKLPLLDGEFVRISIFEGLNEYF